MATATGADLVANAFEWYGVKHVFGNPGTTELPIIDALKETPTEYVLGLHEDIAIGMAAGYARTCAYRDTREPLPVGVANLHIAPGLAHGLSNLYNAWRGSVPLVVTAGNHRTEVQHKEPILAGELTEMASPVTKWSAEVPDVSALPTMLRRAFRTALSPPTGPVFLGLPLDVMLEQTAEKPKRLGGIPAAGRGDPDSLARAAEILCNTEEVTLVAGDGIARSGMESTEALVQFVEAAGARVHGEILTAEISFPTDHEQWVSYIPGDGEKARNILDTDVLVLAGCSTNTPVMNADIDVISEDTTCIHINVDSWELGKNEPADVSIIGDPGHVFEDLKTLLREGISEEERQSRINLIQASTEPSEMGAAENPNDPRMSKADLVDTIGTTLSDAYIVDEGVTSKYVMLSRASMEPHAWIGNKGGGLGYGLPASIGAAIAESMYEGSRNVLGFIGDGSYLYYPQTIYSAVRHDVDLTIVIPDNRNYRILKENTLKIMGGTEADYDFSCMDFDPQIAIPELARGYGADARLIQSIDEFEEALDESVNSSGPTILDVLVHD